MHEFRWPKRSRPPANFKQSRSLACRDAAFNQLGERSSSKKAKAGISGHWDQRR